MKNKVRILVLILLTISSRSGFSQINTVNAEKKHLSLSVGYWGLNDLGIQLGIEKNHFFNDKYRNCTYVSFLSNRKPDIYTGLGIRIGNSFCRTFKSGFYLEYGLFIGYLGSKYDFEVYRLNNLGEIMNVGRPWFHALIAGFTLGAGYDFNFIPNSNGRLFLKPNLFYKIPNNDNMAFINNIVLELGCSFDLKIYKNNK